MVVLVVDVGEMRMAVGQRRMPVRMAMPLPRIEAVDMVMLMVLVVLMAVGVLNQAMLMFVLMVLRQVQPDANAHQASSSPEGPICRFAESEKRDRGPYKRGSRKVGTSAR